MLGVIRDGTCAGAEVRMHTDFDNSPTLALSEHMLRALYPKNFPPSELGRDGQEELGEMEAEEAIREIDADPQGKIHEEADALDRMGRSEVALGNYRAGRSFHEKAMEIRRGLHGEADPCLAQSFCCLGTIAYHEGKLDEAEWHFRQARAAAEARLGRSDPQVGMILNNLGVIASSRGDDAAARELYEAALALKVEERGWEDASVAATVLNLGRLAERAGDFKGALTHYAQARATFEICEGATGAGLAAALLGLGRVQTRRGAIVEAVFSLERALRIREAIACSPAQLAGARFFLAVALEHRKPEEARALVVWAIRDYRAHEGGRAENVQAMEAWLMWHDARHLRRAG